MVSISIITPTIGRDSLGTMLDRLLPQLSVHDEVLVIGDGPQPTARKIVDHFKSPCIKYSEYGPIWNYGNPQRNVAMAMARGQYIMFVDDDDMPEPNAVKNVRQGILDSPSRPLMFKMKHPNKVIWDGKKVALGNVSGQMLVTPNIKGRLGKWNGKYASDFDFIESTVNLHHGCVIWREELILVQGLAGHGTIGHEILG